MKWPDICRKCGGLKGPLLLESGDTVIGYKELKICNCSQSSTPKENSFTLQKGCN